LAAVGGTRRRPLGIWLAIERWLRQDEHRSTFAAKPETNYLYGAVVWWADAAINARPTAKPWTLAESKNTPL